MKKVLYYIDLAKAGITYAQKIILLVRDIVGNWPKWDPPMAPGETKPKIDHPVDIEA